MRPRGFLLAAALIGAAACQAAAADARPERPRLVAELGAGPIIGLDAPLRGAAVGVLLGVEWLSLEACIGADAAADRSLGAASVRIDLNLGLGGGMRVIVGGLVPLSRPVLEPDGAALPLEPAGWPCRFGLSSRIIDLSRGPFGSRIRISASIVYCAYRAAAAAPAPAAALSGAAAFAASVEASAAVALAWGGAP